MTVTTRVSKGSPLTNTEMDSNLNSLNWRTGATIASASTITLAEEFNSFSISGSTTITGITKTSAETGFVVRFYFLGSCTLTQNATSFQLPGEANITTQVGDRATFMHVGSQNWRCIEYTPNSISPHPLDEDAMTSNSATHLATQQSIKTYVDERIVSLTNNNIVSFTISSLGAATGNPAGYSAAKIATGHFRITHPLGDTDYDIMITVDGDGAEMTANYLSKTSTTFDIYTWVNGVLTKPRSVDIYIRDRS